MVTHGAAPRGISLRSFRDRDRSALRRLYSPAIHGGSWRPSLTSLSRDGVRKITGSRLPLRFRARPSSRLRRRPIPEPLFTISRPRHTEPSSLTPQTEPKLRLELSLPTPVVHGKL